MRSAERLALSILLSLAVLVGGTAGAGVYAWHQAGTMRLAVHENQSDGVNLDVTLPGLLVNAAIALCPLPSDLTRDAGWEMMLPALRGVADQLASMPDAVIVDIDDHGEIVRIAKTGRELVVLVHTCQERIEIELPIESVRRLVAKLEARAAA